MVLQHGGIMDFAAVNVFENCDSSLRRRILTRDAAGYFNPIRRAGKNPPVSVANPFRDHSPSSAQHNLETAIDGDLHRQR